MLLEITLLILGFALLIKGADWLVDGASSLARKHNVSDLVIGLTIVAFGTSMPELVVNVFASVQKHGDIVFGNIIGSNIFNVFAILGIAGIITPLVVQSVTVRKEIPFSFLAIVVMYILSNDLPSTAEPVLSRIDGALLLFLFLVFVIYIYYRMKNDQVAAGREDRNIGVARIWFYITAGLVFLVAGGRLVVSNAIMLAKDIGVSEAVISLTIVAAGTSLPELATSVVAALKKNNDIAVGNIVGSNIFNIFLILGISTLINPAKYDRVMNTEVYLLGAGTIFLFTAMFLGKKRKLERWEASVLLGSFILYTIYLIVSET